MTGRAAALLGTAALTLPLWPAPWLGVPVMVGVLLALVVLDWRLATPPGAIEASRHGDRTVRLGETVVVSVHLHNTSTRPLRGLVRDSWVPSAGARIDFPGAPKIEILPGGRAVLPTRLTPTRRGDRPALRLTLRSYGPLGLAFRQRAEHPATPPWTLRVLPRFESRRHLPEKLARLRVMDGTGVSRGRGQGTEFDTLREYVVGDDVRSVDWRASARRADVMVRTWRPERDRRVVCVLDTGRTAAVRVGDEPRLDAAIDAALLLAALAARAGDRVDVLGVDNAVRVALTGGAQSTLLARMVDALAPLQPTLVETDFALIAGEILRRERRRCLVVLFTALEPGALGEGLLPVLPRLATRHKLIVASVHDPVLRDLTTRSPERVQDVYAAASAWRALADRDRVRTALARHGVTVVDAPADRLASMVSDTYLRLKALGQL
ncbi:DUF58 domain-containing protein [Plantactinospora sp. S1510]|uniref:DUF58 domain-containing protein n=1 Tax=Plantactinospora alkalitolerans TaxID=2789879 RepID=A0ABS0GNA7_9ACTN|nr:DUF58 domain-containing protein [Plantactinospora alkalitolerans]MBF9127671.1 DUF58 domain-containing protein [Plantactinospora alkalitolerans]